MSIIEDNAKTIKEWLEQLDFEHEHPGYGKDVYKKLDEIIYEETQKAAYEEQCEQENVHEEKGWTITYIPWEDMEGKPRVAGRFKTTKEKDEFLEKIHKPDSGWMDEELAMIGVINDYNYMLPR